MKPRDLTVELLAGSVDVPLNQLWAFARSESLRCKPARIKVVRGKRRLIDPPTYDFKRVGRRVHRFFKKNFPPNATVHGGAPGRSCVTAARLHLGKRVVLARDIKDCYPSITRTALKKSLIRSGFRRDVAILLSMLMTVAGRVPHGSPISSDALNLYCRAMDRRLLRARRRLNVPISRTYDDITSSTDNYSLGKQVARIIEDAILGQGFEINERKRRKHGVQLSSRAQHVHSLGTSEQPRLWPI